MKKRTNRKEKTLAQEHARLFVPVPYFQAHDTHDLRQPDFRPLTTSVVAGGAAEQPVESWSIHNAKLGAGLK